MGQPVKILVIGDIILDRYTTTQSDRVSVEAPSLIIKHQHTQHFLGGAANVALNLKQLGHEPWLIGAVGNDDNTQYVRQLLTDNGITNCLFMDSVPTIVKHRIVANGQLLLRMDYGQRIHNATSFLVHNLQQLQMTVPDIQAIVIVDYAKGTMTQPVVQQLQVLSVANPAAPIPVFVERKPWATCTYEGATLLKPNLAEAREMLADNPHPGLLPHGDVTGEAAIACSLLRQQGRYQYVVVTMGANGCCYNDPADDNHIHFYDAADKAPPYDVCGAGDTTMAALVAAMVEGRDISAAADFSMMAAGVAVSKPGTVAPSRDEIEEFADKRYPQKIKTMQGLLEFVARKRRLYPHYRIVVANGCFDALHAGHIETFRFAKQQGEVLIVAYNDDESLRALKGETRPHVPDSFRASHIAEQQSVDAVVRFNGDMEQFVRAVKPDVLVKGGDTRGTIPGADFVAAHGGKVCLCPIGQFYVNVDRNHPFGSSNTG